MAGDGPLPRPQGCPQVAQAEPGHRSRRRRALPPRGRRRRRPDPPEHRRRPRRVRGRRAPSRRHAAHRRQEPASTPRRPDEVEPRADDPHRHVRRLGARCGPPGRVRPSRRQARQHPRHARRPRAAHRLRDRQGARHVRRRPDERQRHDGHGEVPVTRAGQGPQARRARRPLLARPRPVRVPRRAGAVPRRDRRRHRPRPAAARSRPISPGCARRSRAASSTSYTGCCRATPTIVRAPAPSCAPNCSASPTNRRPT